MEAVILYHNPRCGKSRGALAILQEQDVPVTIIEYLKNPPDRETLDDILDMIADPPHALVRRGDPAWKEHYADRKGTPDRAEVLEILTAHPALMQRPVGVRGDNAVIARPSDKILELLDD